MTIQRRFLPVLGLALAMPSLVPAHAFGAEPILMWSYAGPIPGWACTQWREDADPYTWQDNYLCSNVDIGMRWNSAGSIPGMRCTAITEGADPHTWHDNFLCVPSRSSVSFTWSSAGPVGGSACVHVNEPADPHTWHDNFLCGSGFGVQIDLVDYFFHDNPRALNIQRITGGGDQQIRAYRATTGYPNGFYVTKIYDYTTNRAPLFVEWYYDDSWIYLVRDTSWQEGNWCTASDGRRHDTMFELWAPGASPAGARTYPRFMILNARYTVASAKIVARFESGPQKCQVCDSPVDGDSGARDIRAVFLPWKTFDLTGRSISGVVDIQVLSGAGSGEHSYLHKILGDLGYEDLSGFQSHYKESQDFPLQIDESRRCAGGSNGSCGVLASGAVLSRGQSLRSCNGAATLIHQTDGNVVAYDRAGALWYTRTAGRATTAFVMQPDGNLVLYNGATPLWNSGTWNNRGARAVMQGDCNLVVYDPSGRVVWATYTFCR